MKKLIVGLFLGALTSNFFAVASQDSVGVYKLVDLVEGEDRYGLIISRFA